MSKYAIEYYTPDYVTNSSIATKTVIVDAETEQAAVSKFEQMYDNCFYVSVRKEKE